MTGKRAGSREIERERGEEKERLKREIYIDQLGIVREREERMEGCKSLMGDGKRSL